MSTYAIVLHLLVALYNLKTHRHDVFIEFLEANIFSFTSADSKT